jgi:hypothetical protein
VVPFSRVRVEPTKYELYDVTQQLFYKYAEIQRNALRLFIVSFNPTYLFRPAPAIFRVVVIKYQVKLFKKQVD